MSSSLVRRFRWFWAWQDEAEEQWLAQMAREEGLHLAGVSYPGTYTFLRGQPSHDVYRLDYRSVSSRDWADYLRSLEDEGWDHVAQMNNWHYFRHVATGEEALELHPDPGAKAEKYRRVLALYVVLLPAWIIVLRSSIWEGPPVLPKTILRFIVLALALLWVYTLVRVVQRANKLRQR
jgi:hypothetical protein